MNWNFEIKLNNIGHWGLWWEGGEEFISGVNIKLNHHSCSETGADENWIVLVAEHLVQCIDIDEVVRPGTGD